MKHRWFLGSFVANRAFTLQLYSNGLCATNIHIGRRRCHRAGRRWTEVPFISLLWKVSRSPALLIKHRQISSPTIKPSGLVLHLRHFHASPPISRGDLGRRVPFSSMTFAPGLLQHTHTSSFPTEMTSVRPPHQQVARRHLMAKADPLKHLVHSSWHHHQSLVILPAYTRFPDSHRLKLIFFSTLRLYLRDSSGDEMLRPEWKLFVLLFLAWTDASWPRRSSHCSTAASCGAKGQRRPGSGPDRNPPRGSAFAQGRGLCLLTCHFMSVPAGKGKECVTLSHHVTRIKIPAAAIKSLHS